MLTTASGGHVHRAPTFFFNYTSFLFHMRAHTKELKEALNVKEEREVNRKNVDERRYDHNILFHFYFLFSFSFPEGIL